MKTKTIQEERTRGYERSDTKMKVISYVTTEPVTNKQSQCFLLFIKMNFRRNIFRIGEEMRTGSEVFEIMILQNDIYQISKLNAF